ncbi:MYB DNA-binding domain-containing protein [Purpureocillium lavendulum]|uniref:MYB DNA-binding domain-containing protein n=1 Tax=Purpureocillium lavendulum TaxID=1247861 RepID=A0AB34FHS4_9HYPO|nr:MYB DNA-binding domain-containing protein [Purpureocillium lavendulum]
MLDGQMLAAGDAELQTLLKRIRQGVQDQTDLDLLNSRCYREGRRIPWESGITVVTPLNRNRWNLNMEATLAFQMQQRSTMRIFISEHKWKQGQPTEEEAVMMLNQGDDSAIPVPAVFMAVEVIVDKSHPGYQISAGITIHFGPPAGVILESGTTEEFHFVGMPPGTILLTPMSRPSEFPNEFNEVNRHLPMAQETLGLARDQLQGRTLDESSKKAFQPLVIGCEEKAKKLQGVFEKVEKGVQSAKDGSVLDIYRTSLLRLDKAHRVETLMRGVLKGLDALATTQLFRTATQSQVALLRDAIEQLSNLESSVPDSDFAGHQTQNSGQGQNIVFGSGKMHNAQHTIVYTNEDHNVRKHVLQALCTSPYLDRKNRNPDRVPGTCEWLMSHNQFQQWRDSKSSTMLWVSANPGCGKSVLAKHLVDTVLPTTQSRTTCFFFFKDDFEDQRTATSALSCILHQLFTQKEMLFSDRIVKRVESYKQHNLGGSLGELWNVLYMASQDRHAGELVCVLDAFDECEDHERNTLAQILRKFYDIENIAKNSVNLKFLVTSRPYDRIGRGFPLPTTVHYDTIVTNIG